MCRRHAVDSDSDIAGTASVTVAGGLATSHGSSFKFRLGVTPHTGRSLALRLVSGAAALRRPAKPFHHGVDSVHFRVTVQAGTVAALAAQLQVSNSLRLCGRPRDAAGHQAIAGDSDLTAASESPNSYPGPRP